jgi:hypothetical protein
MRMTRRAPKPSPKSSSAAGDDDVAVAVAGERAPTVAQAGARRGRSTAGSPAKIEATWIVPRLRAVTNHAAEYRWRWCESSWIDVNDLRGPCRRRMQSFAVLLVAAGRGPARLPTCEHTLRNARIWTSLVYDRSTGLDRGVGDLSSDLICWWGFFQQCTPVLREAHSRARCAPLAARRRRWRIRHCLRAALDWRF